MNSRIEDLETRRRALLARCEEQRLELAYRVAQIRPAAQLTAWTRRTGKDAGKSPVAWLAAAAGLLVLLRRRRRVLSCVGWITGLFALATRATTLLRVIAQLRAIYVSYKAARRPQA
jgi:MYXO-CTERM domain-containing protein